MTEDRVNLINDIVFGIARRSAYKFKTKDVDEIAQDLWVHILEKENSLGQELDLDLIAKICYDRIVDIQRYDMRRNAISFEEKFENTKFVNANAHWACRDEYEDFKNLDKCFYSESAESCIDRMAMDDLFKIFPEGSKERTFLEFWATATEVKDFGIRGEGKYQDGYTESDLAHKLGYAGTASGGYKSFRKKMRNFVAIYFDVSR